MQLDFGFIEKANRDSPLYRRFQNALLHFLRDNHEVNWELLMVCGSFAKNKLSETSDIDVVMLIPEGSADSESFKESYVDNIPIQLFKFTSKDLAHSFAGEMTCLHRQRSSLLSSGVVVSGDASLGKELIEKAREAFTAALPLLSLENARSMINYLESQFPEKMDRLYATTKYGFMIAVNGMMDRFFNLLHQMNSKPIPRDQEIDATLSSIPDRECGRLFCQILVEENIDHKKQLFYEFANLVCARLHVYIQSNYQH